MITEDYVSFTVAKLLKEKGFDEECYAYYNIFYDNDGKVLKLWRKYPHRAQPNSDYLNVPTLQMAMKWLRNIHGLFIHIDVIREASCWLVDIQDIRGDVSVYPIKKEFPNYEEACEEAIKYCLENLI